MKGKRMNGVARGWRVVWVVSGLAGMAAGQTLTTLHSFDGRNGADPGVALVQELNGDLYGTTTYGGSAQSGTIFRVTQQGGFQKVYDFPSGTYDSALTVVSNGTLYGTTVVVAGPTVSGTLFKMLPGGTPQTIHNFDSTEGQPGGGVVQGFNGMFYGFASMPFPAKGIIYESMPDGTVTILHAFSGSDGWAPVQGLTQGTDRRLYGATYWGGAYGSGAVFNMKLDGVFTLLYSFNENGGTSWSPQSALVEGNDGNFYGVTGGGPTYAGTVFQITPAGVMTTLHWFGGVDDGSNPSSALVLGSDGNFYGTTPDGGVPSDKGTVFRISADGALTTLHTFNGPDGAKPYGGLVQATDGNFYGTTSAGGGSNYGTVFRLSVGLGPFVKAVPWFGKAGAKVAIIGTDLTGATSVTFNGTAAAFTVVSPTEIQTTVPAGASTGVLQVVTPGGTLAGNVAFQVL